MTQRGASATSELTQWSGSLTLLASDLGQAHQKYLCMVTFQVAYIKSLRRVAVRSFASIAKPTVVPTRPTTPWTAIAMTAIVSPSRQQQVSPLNPRSPTRSLEVIRAWPLCRPCLRLFCVSVCLDLRLRGGYCHAIPIASDPP
jgi:hypothetical protein